MTIVMRVRRTMKVGDDNLPAGQVWHELSLSAPGLALYVPGRQGLSMSLIVLLHRMSLMSRR